MALPAYRVKKETLVMLARSDHKVPPGPRVYRGSRDHRD
jgi:hypothetical protein